MQIEQVSEKLALRLTTSKAELERHYAKVGRLYLRKSIGLDLAVQDARFVEQKVNDLYVTQEYIAKVLRDSPTA